MLEEVLITNNLLEATIIIRLEAHILQEIMGLHLLAAEVLLMVHLAEAQAQDHQRLDHHQAAVAEAVEEDDKIQFKKN